MTERVKTATKEERNHIIECMTLFKETIELNKEIDINIWMTAMVNMFVQSVIKAEIPFESLIVDLKKMYDLVKRQYNKLDGKVD